MFAAFLPASLREALALVAGLAVSSMLWMAWDVIDDAGVAREARREYVRISELEAERAKLERERALRLAAIQREAELKADRDRYAAALAEASRDLALASVTEQDLTDEIDELRRARPADRRVPTVRELVGDRLRN